MTISKYKIRRLENELEKKELCGEKLILCLDGPPGGCLYLGNHYKTLEELLVKNNIQKYHIVHLEFEIAQKVGLVECKTLEARHPERVACISKK